MQLLQSLQLLFSIIHIHGTLCNLEVCISDVDNTVCSFHCTYLWCTLRISDVQYVWCTVSLMYFMQFVIIRYYDRIRSTSCNSLYLFNIFLPLPLWVNVSWFFNYRFACRFSGSKVLRQWHVLDGEGTKD